jgi:hypothetical protein
MPALVANIHVFLYSKIKYVRARRARRVECAQALLVFDRRVVP